LAQGSKLHTPSDLGGDLCYCPCLAAVAKFVAMPAEEIQSHGMTKLLEP